MNKSFNVENNNNSFNIVNLNYIDKHANKH